MPSGFAKAIAPTRCEGGLHWRHGKFFMIRWLIVVFLALMLINWFSPLMQRLGFGKLPGDLRFRMFGREWFIPLATTIILSLIAGVISKLI
jgi:hypothetical protein